MLRTILPLLTLLLVLSTSCTRLPLYKSQAVDTQAAGMREAEYAYYSTAGEIAYVVRHDDKNLYLSLSTASRPTIARLLRNGLKFCVDTTAKKKQELYFQYPVSNISDSDRRKEEMGFGDGPGGPPMQLPGSNGPREAVFVKGGVTRQLNLDVEDRGFRGKVRVDSSGVLFYSAAVPLKELSGRPITDWKKVAIGIYIKGLDVKMSPGPTAGSVASNPNQPMAGNRMPGAGVPRGPIGATGAGMTGSSQINHSVKIWFQLEPPAK